MRNPPIIDGDPNLILKTLKLENLLASLREA